MAGPTTGTQKLSKNIVTSTVKKDKVLPVLSDSSSDESEVPSLCVLKSVNYKDVLTGELEN